MNQEEYKKKKVMGIGVVSELTELTERKIRYYEERKLILPRRTEKGTRLYSFEDVDLLIEVSKKVEKGVQTYEIKKEMKKESNADLRKKLLQGQINAHFGIRK